MDTQRPKRWMRRLEGAPASVEWVATGPPELALNNRAELLAALRKTMTDNGFEISRVRKGFRRRDVIDGERALRLIQAQEQSVEEQSHWWADDIVWRSAKGGAVVSTTDPDGNDLVFYGWGKDAHECLGAVESRLLGHVDGADGLPENR